MSPHRDLAICTLLCFVSPGLPISFLTKPRIVCDPPPPHIRAVPYYFPESSFSRRPEKVPQSLWLFLLPSPLVVSMTSHPADCVLAFVRRCWSAHSFIGPYATSSVDECRFSSLLAFPGPRPPGFPPRIFPCPTLSPARVCGFATTLRPPFGPSSLSLPTPP